jgi:phenylacetate-CoA ligase
MDFTYTRPRPAGPGLPSEAPPAPSERLALAAFRRAAASSAGYRAVIDAAGIDPAEVRSLREVPYVDKRQVFAGDVSAWLATGRIAGAAELLTSSGQSGAFSIGVSSHAERDAQEAMTDAALRGAGAREDRPTLLLNCLPMGISVPTRLATVATPSVHLEMALEIMARLGPGFARLIILAEPLFLKELGEAALDRLGPSADRPSTACFVGGEWVAESWRRYVAALFGLEGPAGDPEGGVFVSMGAAELGLHALFETPELRLARSVLDEPLARRAVFGRDPGYTPSLFAYDPERLHFEERVHPGGERTLVCTTLTRRLLPLVRYDLDDLGEHVAPEILNAELAARGCPARVHGPVVAVWGRRAATVSGPGWSLRPEPVKERLFAYSAEAASLTGRFRIEGGPVGPVLHVELRAGAAPTPGLTAQLGRWLELTTGARGRAIAYLHREYPFHLPGDFQHKAVYTAPAAR